MIKPEKIEICEGYMIVGWEKNELDDLFEIFADAFNPDREKGYEDMMIRKVKVRCFPEKISLS